MKLSFSRMDREKGRDIDSSLGVLTGEAAGQRWDHPRDVPKQLQPAAWSGIPSERKDPQDYYRLSMVKEPVWIWSVPAYFHVGGVAGGCAVRLQPFSGVATAGSAAAVPLPSHLLLGASLGAALLTSDLGRPSRFLYMLRVLRPTSPMSIGSWTLAEAVGLSAVALFLADRPRRIGVTGRMAGYMMGVNGILLSGYTGILLANTAVPLWRETRSGLPLLFTASAAASSAALLEMLPLTRREEKVVTTFGVIGKSAELAAVVVVETEASRHPGVNAPLLEGRSGALWKGAKLLMLAGVALVSFLTGGDINGRSLEQSRRREQSCSAMHLWKPARSRRANRWRRWLRNG